MPAVCRVGDALDTGHGCAASTTIDSSNTDGTVTANGINIIVIGAPTVAHPFPPDPPCADHVETLTAGSGTVTVNGIAVGRVGDAADAGAMTAGSGNVSAG
tara:strand:- start:15 stop:317 length:303 start_codon:yes stop_codon:yes gene_type:complete